MLIQANAAEIRAILGAMRQVITAQDTLPIGEIDEKTLSGAYHYMFGQTGDLDIDSLTRITPAELASTLVDREESINAVRFMAVYRLHRQRQNAGVRKHNISARHK